MIRPPPISTLFPYTTLFRSFIKVSKNDFLCQYKELIIIFKICFVNTSNIKTTGTYGLLNEVTGESITSFQLKLISYAFRYNCLIGRSCIIRINYITFKKIGPEKIPVIAVRNPFENYTKEVVIGLYYSRFSNKLLNMTYFRI